MAETADVGFFSFTEVTDPKAHRAYNEWHQLDHLPEQLPLRGVIGGQRWVLTPACEQFRRTPADQLEAVQYVTCYLMAEPIRQTLRDFMDLADELRKRGRFFEQRRAHLSGPFAVTAAHAAERVLVSEAAVAFRPNLGAAVALWDGDGSSGAGGTDAATVASGEGAHALHRQLLAAPGVAGVWDFASQPLADRGIGTGGRSITLCYLDAPPLEVGRRVVDLIEEHPPRGRSLAWLGVLETVTPWQWDWFDG